MDLGFTWLIDLIKPLIDFIFSTLYSFQILLESMIQLFVSLYGLMSTLVTFVTSFMAVLGDDPLTGIIILQLTIVFSLRIYYFAKDIEILGNKV